MLCKYTNNIRARKNIFLPISQKTMQTIAKATITQKSQMHFFVANKTEKTQIKCVTLLQQNKTKKI